MPKPFDIYSIIGWLIVLTAGWVLQFFGWKSYFDARQAGEPQIALVDVEALAANETQKNRPLGELAAERGVAVSDLVFTPEAAEEIRAEYLWDKYLSLTLGLLGTLGLIFAANRLEKPWWTVILVILFGPLIFRVLYD